MENNYHSTKMALKYEVAWHKLYYDLSRWKQKDIIDDPDGRVASELAHEAALLAESENFKPSIMKYAGKHDGASVVESGKSL